MTSREMQSRSAKKRWANISAERRSEIMAKVRAGAKKKKEKRVNEILSAVEQQTALGEIK